MKLLCRTSYEAAARSPFDNPLSSRFDENDAVLIFDQASSHGRTCWSTATSSGPTLSTAPPASSAATTSSPARAWAVKLDFMAGLFARGIAANGTDEFRGVQVALGDVLAWRNLIWRLTTAMALDPQPGPGDSVMPKLEYAAALRVFATECWPTVRRPSRSILGGARSSSPSSVNDLLTPELRPLIEPLLSRLGRLRRRSDQALQADLGRAGQRVRRPARALRAQLLRQQRADPPGRRQLLPRPRPARAADALVDQCLSDYDESGWTSDTWVWRRQGLGVFLPGSL